MTATATAPAQTTGLRADAVGLREVLFQSITAMAPGAAIAASIPAGAAFAGGSLPLSVLLALVACLLTALCIGELARHLPSAGSVATYTARGLHPAVGFLVAWVYVFVEALVPTLLFLQLGFTVADVLHREFSSYPDSLWWPWSLVGAVIILGAGFLGTRSSARLGTALGAFEIAVFVVLAVLLIIKAGSHNTAQVLTTHFTPSGHKGIAVSVACIGFFLRTPGVTFNPLLHGLVPVLSVLAFIPALLTAAGIKSFSFVTPLTAPVSYAGPIVGVWVLLGLIYLAVLMVRSPGRVRDVGLVHLDDAGAQP